MHLARLQFKGIFDRLRLSFVWHDAEDVSRLENLADRHGDRLARDLLGTAKPSFTNLLAPASLIKGHDDVWFFSLKIGRGIVERQMPVLAYADKGRINCLATNQFSQTTTRLAGSSWAFTLALSGILVWALTGPLFGFSDTWQLVVNTATTVITFLMVFLIQRSQNKDTLALELKLNEIVAALQGASNRLISIEDLSEDELEVLRRHYHVLAAMARRDSSILASHSIEEAEARH